MVEFLNKKIGEKINPVYCIQEIDVTQLEIARADALLHNMDQSRDQNHFK